MQFTKELIKNSGKNIPETRTEIKAEKNFQKSFKKFSVPVKKIKTLKIPEPIFPSRLQYLHPTPDLNKIDLGKLNILVKDFAVKSIECNGQGENIIVRGTMGTKPTNIILNKDEIEQVIKNFSDASKIPIQEGVFKVAFGNLILSAIISKVVGSKFIINKMRYMERLR